MNTKQKRLQHEKDYVSFLEKRLRSPNYRKKASEAEYEETERKFKKAKLILRVLEK